MTHLRTKYPVDADHAEFASLPLKMGGRDADDPALNDPAADSRFGQLYTKKVASNRIELFYLDDAGNITQITAAGTLGDFDLVGTPGSTDLIRVRVTGDVNPRGAWRADGSFVWSDPNVSPPDTFMNRFNPGSVGFGRSEGAVPHLLRIWNLFTVAGANQEAATIGWQSNTFVIGDPLTAGTGVFRPTEVKAGTDVLLTSGAGFQVKLVDATGHLHPVTDGAQDLGIAGGLWRDVRWSRQALAANGTYSTTSYGFSTQPVGFGFSFVTAIGNGIDVVLNSAAKARFDATGSEFGLVLDPAAALSWNSGGFAQGSMVTADVKLFRGGAAGILELKNGTAAQTLRVYGTTTGPRYTAMFHDGTDAYLGSVGGGDLGFQTIGTSRWRIGATALFPSGGGLYDVGDSTNTVRHVIVGTSVQVGTIPATVGAGRFAKTSALNWRNDADSANIVVLDCGGAGVDIIGLGRAHTGALLMLAASGSWGLFGASAVARTAMAAATGTATRTTFDTATVTTAQLAERFKAMIDDWRATGYWS